MTSLTIDVAVDDTSVKPSIVDVSNLIVSVGDVWEIQNARVRYAVSAVGSAFRVR